MTEKMATHLLTILQSSYPGEAYKLDGAIGDAFRSTMQAMFKKFPDEDISSAVGAVIKHEKKLPSLAIIHDVAVNIAKIRKEREKVRQISEPRQAVNMDQVNAARATVGQGITGNVSEELMEFARQHFPDISSELVERNYCELAFCYSCRMQMDGHNLKMWLNKRTGVIETHVVA
jgi:hypothetical protein